MMKSFKYLPVAAAGVLLSLAGCGGGNDGPPPTLTTQILSDSGNDGDIELALDGSAVVTQGMSPNVQNVLAGIDPVAGSEFRAFLDFPLTGHGGVPADATIDSAFLEVYIDDLQPSNAVVPVRVDLVSFQTPLLPDYFSRSSLPPLSSTTLSPALSAADSGKFVPIDVTALMVEAQRRGLNDFQVRILEDVGPPIVGLFAIDDSTGSDRSSRAPLLTVTYF